MPHTLLFKRAGCSQFLLGHAGRGALLLLALLLGPLAGWGQSSQNYAFSTSATGSLALDRTGNVVDMSTGTTQLVAAGLDDDNGIGLQTLPIPFTFMGTAFTQFSANSNGLLRLGPTVIAASTYTVSTGTAASPIISAFGGDLRTGPGGKVHYKTVGTAPNRTLVVEFNNMTLLYVSSAATATNDGTYQVRLYESTGVVEFVYGAMFRNAGTTASNSQQVGIGFVAGSTSGTLAYILSATNANATTAPFTQQTYTVSTAIPNLNSTTNGARRVYTYVPPVPAAPTTLTFSPVTTNSIKLNWVDASTSELQFRVLRSPDNITFTQIGTVASTTPAATGGAYSYTDSGLASATTYYYQVVAYSEGAASPTLTGSQATAALVPLCGTYSVGPTGTYSSITAALSDLNLNGIGCAVVFELQSTYVSTVETFPITYTYTGGSATNTVTVRPATGATGRSITSSTAATLSISGGKYLVLDGRPGGSGTTVSGAADATNDLTIANTNTSGIPLTFTSDAQLNTVQHCQVKGVGTGTSYPNISFSSTVVSAGNSSNTIQYNNVGDGATLPTLLVASGSSSNASNTIANNNLFNFYYASGNSYGIYLSSAGSGWSISGNSFYQTASRTPVANTQYAINIAGGGGHTIANNAIGGNAAATISTTGPATLSGTWATSATAAAYRFVGIYLSGTTTATTLQNNTIGNFSWYSSSTATGTAGVWGGVYVLSNATVQSNTIGGNVTITTTATGSMSYGIFSSAAPTTLNVNGNTVAGMTMAGSTTSITNSVTGIHTQAPTTNIYQNKVYGLAAANAGTAYGINAAAGTTTNVYNNLIGNLTASASTVSPAVVGLYVGGGTTVNAYYNTINLSGTSTGTNFGAAGVYATTAPTLTLTNNIVVNAATPTGTGVSAAYRRSSTTLTTYSTASNNNLFYTIATPTTAQPIFYDGTNTYATLAAYKTAMSTRDQASVTENPPFASTTGTATNYLHIATGTATQVESGGQAIGGFTTDYDGDTRSSTPDIGADEGTFTPNDLTAPTITYTALANTTSTASRTLSVSINDVSGIATGTGAPLLYYRVGTSGAFTAVAASTAPASAPYTGTYTFSIPGAAQGSTVQYYVAAQDASANNNSGTSPSGGSGTNPPGTTAPGTFSAYTILLTLSGDYYILGTAAAGTSPDPTKEFATLTAAAAAYNGSGLGGPVRFLLFSTTQGTETYPINFGANQDASSTNTLTIKPHTGITTTFTNTTTNSTFKVTSGSYITFDGSNTTGGTTRDLTLSNTSTSATAAALVWLASTTTAPVTNVQVRNLNLLGANNSSSNTNAGVMVSNTTYNLGTGASANSVVIANNSIQGTSFGIVEGNDSATPGTGLQITGNVVGPATAAAATNIGLYGIFVGYATAPAITGNTVQNVVSSTDCYGLLVTGSATGGTVSRNKILNIISGTGGYSGHGIDVNGVGTSANLTLTNNFVAGIGGTGYYPLSSTSNGGITGIRVYNGTMSGITLYHNSVNLTGTASYNDAALVSAALYVSGNVTGLTVVNNILVNNINSTANASGPKAYALYSAAPTTAFTALNYNDYFVSVPTNSGQGYIGAMNGTDAQTFAAFKTASGKDGNSLNINPAFTSATDLHTTNVNLAAGQTGTGVTVDIDGTNRSTTYPYLGAAEGPAPMVMMVSGITYTQNSATTLAGSTNQQVTGLNIATVNTLNPLSVSSITFNLGSTSPADITNAKLYSTGSSATFATTTLVATTGAIASPSYTLTLTTAATLSTGNNYFWLTYDIVSGATPGNTVASVPTTVVVSGTSYTGSSSPAITLSGPAGSRTILGPLAGTYYLTANVGSSPTPAKEYPTLTAAVSAYNAQGVSAAVSFVLLDATYSGSETFPIVLNATAGASATNTLTIKPGTGVSATVSGSVASGSVIKLNGADYVTIDGSNNGTTSQNLTIANTSATGSGNAVLWLTAASAADGATNNTVKNTSIVGNSSAGAPQFTVYVGGGGATPGSATATLAPNSNNTLTNNVINKGFYGLTLLGVSATSLDQGNVVTGNRLGGSGAGNGFGLEGLRLVFQQGGLVRGNTVQGITNATTTSNIVGINLISSQNTTVSGNLVAGISYTGTSTAKVNGIQHLGTAFTTAGSASANTFSNNLVYNLNSSGTSSFYNLSGIQDISGYGDKFYFNTVYLSGQLGASTGASFAFANGNAVDATAASALDLRNNIFSIIGGTNAAAGTFYANYTYAASYSGSTLNNNDLFVTVGGSAVAAIGYLGTGSSAAGTSYPTLMAWQTATSQEGASVSTNPLFRQVTTMPYDLTPAAAALDGTGVTIAGITTDYAGTTRTSPPDMGALEFTPPTLDLKPVALVAPTTTQGCYTSAEAVTVQVQNNAAAAVNFATSNATVTVVVTPPSGAANNQTLTGTITSGTLGAGLTQNVTLTSGGTAGNGTLDMSAYGTYTFAITATVAGDQNMTNDNLTPNPTRTAIAPTAGAVTPATSTVCQSGTVTLTLAGAANGTIQWQSSPDNLTFTDVAGANAATYTTPTLSGNTTVYYRAQVRCNGNTVTSTNAATINVYSPQAPATNSPVTRCGTGTVTLTATPSPAAATISWYSASTGGTALATGTSYSPTVTASTTYYAASLLGGCASPTRTAVTVTVNPPPALAGSPAAPAICSGSSVAVSYTASYVNLSVSPTTGATVSGSTITYSPTATTTYTVTGNDGTGASGCSNTTTTTITVNPVPNAPTLSPTAAIICAGNSTTATASSSGAGTVAATALTATFNSGTDGFTTTNTGTGIYGFARQTPPYNMSSSFTAYNGIDGTPFFNANPDKSGSGTTVTTTLTSPVVDLTGYTAANLSFQQFYNYYSSGDIYTRVEIYTASTGWVTLIDYKGSGTGQGSQGTSTAPATASFTVPAANLGKNDVQVRFSYSSAYGLYWNIDNVSVTGTKSETPTYAVTPAAGASVSGSTITFSPTATTTYNVTASYPSTSCASAATPITITVNTSTTWMGATNTDWFTSTNWSACVPTRFTDATVPGSVASGNYPNLTTAATAEVRTLTLASGSSLSQSAGTLNIYGNLANDAAATLTMSGGMVGFLGATATVANPVTFYNLTTNLSSAGSTVALSGNNAVSNSVTMTQGLLTTSGILTLAPAATIAETDASYVMGKVAAQRTLAAGTGDNFGGIGLTLTPAAGSTSPGATSVVRTTGATLTGVGTSMSVQRYFDINPATNTGLDVQMDFLFFNHENTNNVSAANFRLYKSDNGTSGPWQSQAGTTTAMTTGGYTVTKTGITDFSVWTVGDATNPLPVSLTRFEAVRQDQNAALTWTTASETDNAGFEVQVSLDGRSFRKLGFVAAASPSSLTARSYSFLDGEAGKAGLRYYRLRQVDLGGQSSFSGVRTVAFDQATETSLSAMPNPFGETLTLNLQTPAATAGTALTLTDALGRVVLRQAVDVPAGASQLTLPNLAELPTGLYVLQLSLGGQVRTVKLVKQ